MPGKLGHLFPRAIDEQELLLHEQAVSDNGSGTDKSRKFGDRTQKMYEEHQQIFHGSEG